jgi:hypothetical protein
MASSVQLKQRQSASKAWRSSVRHEDDTDGNCCGSGPGRPAPLLELRVALGSAPGDWCRSTHAATANSALSRTLSTAYQFPDDLAFSLVDESMLRPPLMTAYACAQDGGDVHERVDRDSDDNGGRWLAAAGGGGGGDATTTATDAEGGVPTEAPVVPAPLPEPALRGDRYWFNYK